MNQHRARPGLTLAELLVVLMILAILTTVAVQSLRGVADQARFEATQRILENVRGAIVGSANTSDPLTGFVADMGRLPASLDELLLPPADASTFGLQAAPAPHDDVLLPRGWRGPYLRLPVGTPAGTSVVHDGWGVPLATQQPSSGELLIASPAAARSADNEAYNHDLMVSIKNSDAHATMITGLLFRGVAAGDSWSVVLLGPGPAAVNNGVQVQSANIVAAANGDVSYTLASGLTIGPRVLRAMKNGIPHGAPVYLTLRPGATHVVNFTSE